MCHCTPHLRTPWCGRPGCHPPGATPERRIDLVLHSLINERVDVRLETIDGNTSLISFAVAKSGYEAREGDKGVAIAMRHDDLLQVWKAIGKMLEPAA